MGPFEKKVESSSVSDDKVARMLRGERVVLSDEYFDQILASHPDVANDIASCHNRKQIGTKDQYVAWIGDENKPKDLEYKGQVAIGSV